MSNATLLQPLHFVLQLWS